jgi:serine/threonine protein kinase
MQHQHQPGRSLEVLHTYTIEGVEHGRGLALAYRARDEQLGDQVVLEVSPRGEGWPDSDYLAQYRSIATKVMRLRHPNIIAIRDFVLHDDQFFVVKQYDPGLTLDVVLHRPERTKFDAQAREHLCKDILRGLAALHRSNIIHRNVSAVAIHVKEQPEPLAQIDHFNLAVSAAVEYLDSDLRGTLGYMAPEIINPPHRYTKQSDVYATGMLLLELLSGRSPGELSGGAPWWPVADALARIVAQGGHVPEQQIRGSVPAQHADALVCATRTSPRERFADCQAFYESFALNAPLRLAAEDDPTGPEALGLYLERLPDGEERLNLLTAQRLVSIDPRMAVAKCRQIVEMIAQRTYSRSFGPPGSKPLVNLVHELREARVIPADVFTHYYNVRKQGNLAVHGGPEEAAALHPDIVRMVLGAAVRIVTWFLLEYEGRSQSFGV